MTRQENNSTCIPPNNVYSLIFTSEGSKIGRVYSVNRVVTVNIFNPKNTGISDLFMLISISRATPWTRLTFDPSEVKTGLFYTRDN